MENLRESNADSNGTFLKHAVGGAVANSGATAVKIANNGGADMLRTAAATVGGGCCKSVQDSGAPLNWLHQLHSNNNNNNSTEIDTRGKGKDKGVDDTLRGVVSASAAVRGDSDSGGCEGNGDIGEDRSDGGQWPSAQNSWRRHCVSCESATVAAAAAVSGGGAATVAAPLHKHNATATVTTTTITPAAISQQHQPQTILNLNERGVASGTNGKSIVEQVTACRPQNGVISSPCDSQSISSAAMALPHSPRAYEACAAALSPPGACSQLHSHPHSNRSASPNNSIENLSYSSDNYFPDNLILLEDDDDDDDDDDVANNVDDDEDVEAEEISLNSDDCVYAYRGEGADFDLALDAMAGRAAGDMGIVDDEMDFLEMDFEPDPLSEMEYGSSEAAPAHADAFLFQRDSCHLSGRHSATLSLHAGTPTQRQLFSSPIEDDLPPPTKGLQSQLMLSKNFARITMHLDQIKGENGDCDIYEHSHSDRASALGMLSEDTPAETTLTPTTAHSLPNTLLGNFGRELRHVKEEIKTSPTKVTGAKPKRFSTFSTSSSTSSKNSSKSRQSLRSNYATSALCNSSSFDERSVSCTEFRCVPAPNSVEDCLPRASATVNNSSSRCDDFGANDEACLDCLEKEFLANTIGKAIDLDECPKCRRRSSGIALYKRAVQQGATTRCRSGSPAFFGEARDECLFERAANDFLGGVRQKADEWTTPIKDRTLDEGGGSSGGEGVGGLGGLNATLSSAPGLGSGVKAKGGKLRARARARTCDMADVLQLQAAVSGGDLGLNQRRSTCDNLNSEHLLKNLLLTEKEVVTIPTVNLSEEMLVQALEKLNITFNADVLKSYFKTHYSSNSNNNSSSSNTNTAITSTCRHTKEYKDLKHFLLHESKKNCNYPKVKRLIEIATRQQIEVQYKKDINVISQELVYVKVSDILHQWGRSKKLNVLKQLDKRFIDANILGKIANVIRQAQQRCTPRRPLPEYISIPQYYASGYLTLMRKC